MSQGRSMRGVRPVVLVALVAFAFWRPLFAGGTLAPDDQLWLSDPYNAAPPPGLTIEVAERDAATIHGAWLGWAEDVRDGDLSWWRDAGAGQPILADGLPFTHLVYLFVPGWYAPGLVAALAVLLAALGAMRLADRHGLVPLAGLFAGVGFGFSGLVFVWIGWPHATAIALTPWVVGGLLGAVEQPTSRRVGGAALAIAAQLWCGVFAISVFSVLGGLAWAGLAGREGRTRRGVGAAAAAVVLGAALAAPHLLPRWERWSWADTTHLEGGDTSAGLVSLVTTAVGSALGNDSVGVAWIGTGSFQLSVGFLGVATLAAMPLAARWGRRAAGPLAVAMLGVAIAYVGGPFATGAGWLIGGAGLASHARVLVVLGATTSAAFGVDVIVRGAVGPGPIRAALASGPARAGVSVAAVAGAGLVLAWFDDVRAASALRVIGAQAIGTLIVVIVLVAVASAWWQRRLTGAAVGTVLVALAAYELLAFGMPIPTVTDRDERIAATDAHRALDAVVADTGRVAGDHDAFSPATAARFGIADVRAPGLRSGAEINAFASVDPSSILGAVGGGPFEPVIRVRGDADPSSDPVWDLLGVDAWVLPRDATPPGPRVDPRPDTRTPVAAASSIARLTVPDGGVRAVVLDLSLPAFSTIAVAVSADGSTVESTVALRSPRDGMVAVALAGEDLTPGADAQVIVTIDSLGQPAEVGTTAGAPAVGTIAGTADSTLVWTDGVLILARPTPRVAWLGAEPADVEVVVDEPDRIVVDIAAPVDGTLRSDLVAEPGWRIRVDDAAAPEGLADDLVLATDLAAGTHRVEFAYRPPRFGAGLGLAALGAVLWAVWALVERRRASQARW